METIQMQRELVHLGNGAHALAIQILGNSEDAADAVHDAFATALARPESYDSRRGALKPWFLRVRNRCIDLLRKRRPTGIDADLLADPGTAPDEQLENRQRDLSLKKALAAISPEKRQIVVVRDYLDLSYAEIAMVLDVAPGTVMSRLHRARMDLKKELEGCDE